MTIPFTKLYTVGDELEFIHQAISNGFIHGDGHFTHRCHYWLEQIVGCEKACLTNSCTAALEMAVILAEIEPGDEVILPSYTFVSTANAVVLRGGMPVFVDIRPDTLNLDESKIEAAITSRTKAVIPVHYAGVGCEMDAIMAIAHRHNLVVIEDGAQAVCARYKGRPLGSYGHLAAYSFHATKNVVSGEGGALLINDPKFSERAEIIWEKGTNRKQFFRGEVDKYTWVDVGSSFLPSELTAAFLLAQLQRADSITHKRLSLWRTYHTAFELLEQQGLAGRPQIPNHCQHNAHIYYLMMRSPQERTDLLQHLKANGVQATFHYVPLHSSPAGQKYGRIAGEMTVTDDISQRIVRLPLSASLSTEQVDFIITSTLARFDLQPPDKQDSDSIDLTLGLAQSRPVLAPDAATNREHLLSEWLPHKS
jgi:dTDP-4-amino-4,6-dideoxygalactose transaminase